MYTLVHESISTLLRIYCLYYRYERFSDLVDDLVTVGASRNAFLYVSTHRTVELLVLAVSKIVAISRLGILQH